MLWYTGDVGNGGHLQYFMNPGGAFAHETIAALESIGAADAAMTLANSVFVFPGGSVSKDRDVRLADLQGLSRDALASLDRADRAIWKVMMDIDTAALRYLREGATGAFGDESARLKAGRPGCFERALMNRPVHDRVPAGQIDHDRDIAARQLAFAARRKFAVEFPIGEHEAGEIVGGREARRAPVRGLRSLDPGDEAVGVQ